jgi:putative tricarboxylic transport membrane protein
MAPLVLALVLGDMAETSFRQSMLISKGSLGIFVITPLAGTITCLAIVMLLWPLLGHMKKLSRG